MQIFIKSLILLRQPGLIMLLVFWLSLTAPMPAAIAQGEDTPRLTIVFQTTSGGPIYALPADCASLPERCSGQLRYLTTGMDPVLSPDGRQVAFTRWETYQDGAWGSLWVINVDGRGERSILGNLHQPKSPTWSPDSASIVLSVQYGGRLQPEEKCSGGRPPAGAYDISTKIEEPGDIVYCYTLPPDLKWGLRRVDVTTGQFEDLPHQDYSYSPTWSPADPAWLVYDGDRGLVRLNLGTGIAQPLTTDVQHHSPTFSPDGSKLAVTYRQDNHWDIHILNADGSGATRLTETSYLAWAEQELRGEKPRSWNNAAPTWSPDGRQLAFVTDRTGQWEIWVMNADGSNQHPLFPPGTLAGVSLQYNGMDERMLSWR